MTSSIARSAALAGGTDHPTREGLFRGAGGAGLLHYEIVEKRGEGGIGQPDAGVAPAGSK
jgi:hypothetical protein